MPAHPCKQMTMLPMLICTAFSTLCVSEPSSKWKEACQDIKLECGDTPQNLHGVKDPL